MQVRGFSPERTLRYRRTENRNISGFRDHQPDGAIGIVGKETVVDRAGEIARPDDFGSINIRTVENPFLMNAVIRAVADKNDVLSRGSFQRVFELLAIEESPSPPALRIADPLRGQMRDIENQGEENHSRKRRTDGTSERPKGAQVANTLHQKRKPGASGGCKVMGPGPNHQRI